MRGSNLVLLETTNGHFGWRELVSSLSLPIVEKSVPVHTVRLGSCRRLQCLHSQSELAVPNVGMGTTEPVTSHSMLRLCELIQLHAPGSLPLMGIYSLLGHDPWRNRFSRCTSTRTEQTVPHVEH